MGDHNIIGYRYFRMENLFVKSFLDDFRQFGSFTTDFFDEQKVLLYDKARLNLPCSRREAAKVPVLKEKALREHPKYLTIKEACQYLGLSRMTLLEAEERQLIRPARTPGGHRRYRYEDLTGYLAATSPANSSPVSASDSLFFLPSTPACQVCSREGLSIEAALRQIVLLLQVEMGGVFTFNENRRRLSLSSSFGIPRWLLTSKITVGLDGVSGRALANLVPVVFDMAESELLLPEVSQGQGLCVPLLAGSEKLGTVQVFASQRRSFFPSEINILTTFAVYLAELLTYKHTLQEQQKAVARQQQQVKGLLSYLDLLTRDNHKAVAMINAAGLIVYWSEAMERLTGLSSLQAVGQPFKSVLPPDPEGESLSGPGHRRLLPQLFRLSPNEAESKGEGEGDFLAVFDL